MGSQASLVLFGFQVICTLGWAVGGVLATATTWRRDGGLAAMTAVAFFLAALDSLIRSLEAWRAL